MYQHIQTAINHARTITFGDVAEMFLKGTLGQRLVLALRLGVLVVVLVLVLALVLALLLVLVWLLAFAAFSALFTLLSECVSLLHSHRSINRG
jgi:hypothetical protein